MQETKSSKKSKSAKPKLKRELNRRLGLRRSFKKKKRDDEFKNKTKS